MNDTAQLGSLSCVPEAAGAATPVAMPAIDAAYGLSTAESAALAQRFSSSPHFDELLLARGCALGREPAWDCFLARYRNKLVRMALTLTKDEASAQDLADSLYADLFGTRLDDAGQRVSKLNLYEGRGSLEGWLRTIVMQEYIARFRKSRHLTSWEEWAAYDGDSAAAVPTACSSLNRLTVATDAALETLADDDRLLLKLYFLDHCSLAHIGRILGRHESSIARRLSKLLAGLRKSILRQLCAAGLSRAEAEQSLAVDVRDLEVDVRRCLQRKEQRVACEGRSRSHAG